MSTLMIMAGGTGGHVYPALAVAHTLQADGVDIFWLGTRDGLEARVVPENLFDIAGVYPLKMEVVGILEATHTSDDLGIFVDLKTAWIIQ